MFQRKHFFFIAQWIFSPQQSKEEEAVEQIVIAYEALRKVIENFSKYFILIICEYFGVKEENFIFFAYLTGITDYRL